MSCTLSRSPFPAAPARPCLQTRACDEQGAPSRGCTAVLSLIAIWVICAGKDWEASSVWGCAYTAHIIRNACTHNAHKKLTAHTDHKHTQQVHAHQTRAHFCVHSQHTQCSKARARMHEWGSHTQKCIRHRTRVHMCLLPLGAPHTFVLGRSTCDPSVGRGPVHHIFQVQEGAQFLGGAGCGPGCGRAAGASTGAAGQAVPCSAPVSPPSTQDAVRAMESCLVAKRAAAAAAAGNEWAGDAAVRGEEGLEGAEPQQQQAPLPRPPPVDEVGGGAVA